MLSFGVIIMLAVCTAIAALMMLSRFGGFRMVLKYHGAVDVVFTIALLFMFAGTITGMLVAVMAGLCLSLLLTICKWVVRTAETGMAKVKGETNDEYTKDGQWIYNTAPYV